MASNMKTFRSRILQYFPKEALEKIKKLIYNNRINDINDKVDMMMDILDEYNIDFDELGTGTNRTAIFIDGYVFKIALDKWGVRDNEQEFTLSEELQPYVIKVYECNSIMMVCEYVVVINKEEFAEHKPQIRSILKDLSNEYLLGDIGTVNKNFANWGYRDNQELVALDFAYIYRVIGNELTCDACDVKPMLEYTPDFDKLSCPHCRKQYSFIDVRRRISKEMETRELEMSKARSYVITNQTQEVELNAEDIEVTDFSQQDRTYKFNLGDFITYRNREEAIEMLTDREKTHQEPQINTFINLNYDPVKEAQEEMLDEIELMMMKKKGYIPPNKPFIGINHEEDEPTYDEDQLRAENEKLATLINHMNGYDEQEEQDEEEEEEIKETSDDDMLEEIESLRKHKDIIVISSDDEENDEDEEYKSIQEVVTEAVVEEANRIAPEKLVLSTTYGVAGNSDYTVQPLTEEEKAVLLSPVDKLFQNADTAKAESKITFDPIDESKLEQIEREIPIKEVIRKCPGRKPAKVRLAALIQNQDAVQSVEVEPIPQPKEVSFQMMLDSEIDNAVWIDPVSEKENNLKMDIQNLLVQYLAEKNVNVEGLDLAIDLSFTKISSREDVEHEEEFVQEIVIGGNFDEEEEGTVTVNGEPINMSNLPGYQSQVDDTLIRLYGNHEETVVEEDKELLTDEELKELYGEDYVR